MSGCYHQSRSHTLLTAHDNQLCVWPCDGPFGKDVGIDSCSQVPTCTELWLSSPFPHSTSAVTFKCVHMKVLAIYSCQCQVLLTSDVTYFRLMVRNMFLSTCKATTTLQNLYCNPANSQCNIFLYLQCLQKICQIQNGCVSFSNFSHLYSQ